VGTSKSRPTSANPVPTARRAPQDKISDFGTQLRAAGAARLLPHITERQFRKIFARRTASAATRQNMTACRAPLDAVIYRSKLAPTPFAAPPDRSHGT